MHKRKRELAILAEREGLSGVTVIVTKGNHFRIEGSYMGHGVKVVTAFSPSDHRGDLNTVSRLRQQVRAVKATYG